MHHTNAAYKEKVMKFPQDFRLHIDVIFDQSTGLENITIPPDDIYTASYDDSAYSQFFAVGGGCTSRFEVRINNHDGKYSNDALSTAELHPIFTLYDNIDGSVVDTVPIGIFFTQIIQINNTDLTLECVDKMEFLDVSYKVQNTQRSLYEICVECAEITNSTFKTTINDVPFLSKVIDDNILNGYSLIEILGTIGTCTGNFVIYNYDGELELTWFKDVNVELTGDMAKNALTLNGNTFSLDGNPVKVTGVKVLSGADELTMVGTDKYCRRITDNPIANVFPEEVANTLYNKIKDVAYIPCMWIRIGGDPSLRVGDIITIIDNKEPYDPAKHDEYPKYKLYLGKRTWNYNGAFSEIYEAKGNSPVPKSSGMTESKQAAMLKKEITEIKHGITTGLDDRLTALLLFNEKMYASMGLHMTTVDDGQGGTITYLHDENELESSMTIYKMAKSGFAWTTDGWKDGNPVWTSGIADNGDAILNQIFAYVVNADLIKTGMLKSQSGGSWINMNSGDFQFAHCDAYIDLDTGEITYGTPEPKLKLSNGELLVNGVLSNIKYKYYKVFVGPSGGNDNGAFTCSVLGNNIFSVSQHTGDDCLISSPHYSERAGIYFGSDGIDVRVPNISPAEFNYLRVGNDVTMASYCVMTGTLSDTLSIGFYGSSHPDNMWINYFDVPGKYYAPQKLTIGNGTQGGLADVECRNVNCNNVYANIGEFNGRVFAKEFQTTSDRALKDNIQSVDSLNAVDMVKSLKFYSYDFKSQDDTVTSNKFNSSVDGAENTEDVTPIHIDIGLIADEVPEQIKGSDGKSIELYSYISMTAKAVQEQQKIIEQLKSEIAELKNQ